MKEKILAEIEELEKKLKDLWHNDNLEYLEAIQKEEKLLKKLKFLQEEAFFCEGPTISNDILDLYEAEHLNHFRIYLHGTRTYVGKIEYRGRMDYYFKDIGYSIDKEHRGHHYALTALKLIRSRIIESGNKEVYISVMDSNIPSIKTIEAFGGVQVEKEHDYLVYKCDIEEENNEISSKNKR